MAIWTKEQDILLSGFPPARLFVDDIEEIVRIFRELVESHPIDPRSTTKNPKIKVLFSTPGEECDDIQDLPKIAKRCRELTIEVSRGDFLSTSLLIHPTFTLLDSSGLTKEEKWSASRKLQPIFNKRGRPFAQAFPFIFSFIVFGTGVRRTILTLHNSWDPSPTRHYLKEKLIPVVVGALLGIGGTILTLYLRHKFWP